MSYDLRCNTGDCVFDISNWNTSLFTVTHKVIKFQILSFENPEVLGRNTSQLLGKFTER